jgi:hypothetical protein
VDESRGGMTPREIAERIRQLVEEAEEGGVGMLAIIKVLEDQTGMVMPPPIKARGSWQAPLLGPSGANGRP